MPKGISGSGGVDSSALDGLINQLNNILDKQNEINATKVSPKADDKGLKPITKTLEEIRNEAKNTSRTNIELWNTKALKKQIGEAKKILDDSLKSFDISKISSENISGFEKEFLNAFATIKTYSEKYGQEIASEYQNMFDAIFNKSDVFKQDDLQALFQKNINAALSNVKKGSFDVKYEADENWAKEQYKAYEQQAQIAKETANVVKQAEREKQEALMDTRDKILEETKTQLQQIKDMSADNKFLEVDDEQWARFQKSAGDMIQTLSEMGVEVRDLEDIFDSLSKKIYIPKDQFASLKQGSITENVVGNVSEINKTQQKVEELYNEISRLQNELYNSPTNEAYKDLDKDYEEARIEITALKSEINDLNAELRYSVDFFTWDQKCEEVERLEKAVDELKNKLKSTGDTGGEGLSEEMSKGFNSEELTSFLNVLERIEQQLKNISATLGTVDENYGFNNMISSIDILLSKLDKMRQKIGTGIYNVEIKQGENFGSTSDLLISNERDKLMQSYNKIVKAFGDEEKLFSTMGSVLSRSSGLGSSSDDLFGLFSKDAVASINNPMEQINRIREFLIRFKEVQIELRQEVELLNKDLEYAQDNLKNISNKDEKNDVKNSIKNIKQQLKSTSELSQMIDKLSTPSSTNAYLNKKIDSANESEKEFIQKMHEMDSVDLSGIIAQLENIAQILTEISQKDLFGDSLFKVSSQLDEIAAKFDNIVANVKVINEEPILTSNQTPLSSSDVEKLEEYHRELTEAVQQEQQTVKDAGAVESGAFSDLANEIKTVTNLVNDKTNAFSEEESKVVKSVDNEINKIKELKDVLSDVKTETSGINEKLKVAAQTSSTVSKKQSGKTASSSGVDISSKSNEQELERLYAESERKRESVLKTEQQYRRAIAEAQQKAEEAAAKAQQKAVEKAAKMQQKVQEQTIKAQQKAANDAAKAEETASKRRETNYTRQTKMIKDFSLWLDKNSKTAKAYRVEIENIFNRLQNSGNLAADELRDVQNEINKLMSTAVREGNTGVAFVDVLKQRFKSLAAYISTFASFYDIVRYVREAFTTIKDLDTQLVDLRKTTTMSTSELNGFYLESNDVAKQMGVTTSEIISQASAWSRLGFSTKEASTEMAALSSQFKQISPGMELDTATDGLVSTMKAFHIDVADAEHEIMDVINQTGNKLATNNDEIVQMLTRSSAAMAAANNSLKETIALESAAVQITRNAETTGTAFRTISMRIRGLDEETEELSEDLQNISGDIADLTKTAKAPGGISLFTDESKSTYKSTYQLLKEISAIYHDLTDKQQAELLEKLAGKRGGQVLAGILDDFSEVERAMGEMENSFGSADREMGIVEESIDYKLNALKETWVGTLQTLADRGTVGDIIDFLTQVSELLGKIISTPLAPILAGSGVGITAFIKNLDQPTFLVA